MVVPASKRSSKKDDDDLEPDNWQDEIDETTKLRHDPAKEPASPDISKASEDIRRGFVRKVYGILSAQLFLTAVVAYYLAWYIEEEKWPAKWIFAMAGIGGAGMMVIFCVSCCSRTAFRTFPVNYFLVLLFTAFQSLVVTFLCYMFGWDIIGSAACMTGGIFVILTLFAMCTSIDFTGCGVYLFGVFVALLVVSVAFGIMHWSGIEVQDNVLYMGLRIAFVVLFSLYLIYDTQLILGGKRAEFQIDDYCWAALKLYYDIFEIFLIIVRLFSGGR